MRGQRLGDILTFLGELAHLCLEEQGVQLGETASRARVVGFVQDGGHSIEDGLEALLDTGDDGEGGGIGHFVFGILNPATRLEFGGTMMMERVGWAKV